MDRLLNSDVSATEISATEFNVSATENSDLVSATEISATKISATKPTADISATKISATKYMNDYKRLHYDTLRIDLPKGRKELLKQKADLFHIKAASVRVKSPYPVNTRVTLAFAIIVVPIASILFSPCSE